MPAGRKTKTKTQEDVPDRGDPDRKRVLNVLAQRRYRQRRREKIEALEAQTKRLTPPQSSDHGGSHASLPGRTSNSQSTSPPDEVEEILRNPDDVGFPVMDFGQDPLDMQFFDNFNLCNLPSPLPPSPISSDAHASPTSSPPTSTSPSTSPPHHPFPLTADGTYLDVPILSAIRAFTSIGTALNILAHVYNPFYMHTLPATPPPNLPPNLHPTPAQVAIPHHPSLDALPWPSIREKVICIFSLPSALRPPIAQDDGEPGRAVMRLLHDLDDMKEGVRVHGNLTGWGDGSELVEESWEIGECFYRNWWWCVDDRIVQMANRRRRERGLGPLRLIDEGISV